jgi:hypothetical protein
VLGALVFSFLAYGLERLAEAVPSSPINASATPLVAALLVLVVLLRFPGGLAQLLRPVFRWLSFGPWRVPVVAGQGAGHGTGHGSEG